MEVPDKLLSSNRDWDPSYLSDIVTQDFFDFNELWDNNVGNRQLVEDVEKLEKYCPIVEDISLEDNVLCEAVESIEKQ